MSKDETKLVNQENKEMFRTAVISLIKKSQDQFLSTVFSVEKQWRKLSGHQPERVEQINLMGSLQNRV